MNSTFESAITAHVLWRMRLEAALNSGDLSGINREDAVKDCACDLGKWIYGPGSVFESHEMFQEFKDCHRNFHLSVGKILRMIDVGDVAGARMEMSQGDFSHCSQDIVAKILMLENDDRG